MHVHTAATAPTPFGGTTLKLCGPVYSLTLHSLPDPTEAIDPSFE